MLLIVVIGSLLVLILIVAVVVHMQRLLNVAAVVSSRLVSVADIRRRVGRGFSRTATLVAIVAAVPDIVE